MCFLLAAKERASSSASPTAPSVISWVAENGRTTISAFIPVTIQNSALAGISRICIAIVMSGCHSTLSRTTTKSAAECACSPPPYPRLFQESIYSCELTIYKISLMKWVRPQKESSERISRILSVIPRLTSLGLGKETRIGCPVSFSWVAENIHYVNIICWWSLIKLVVIEFVVIFLNKIFIEWSSFISQDRC